MALRLKDKTPWHEYKDVTMSGTDGLNPAVSVVKRLRERFDGYEFGLCPYDELPMWESQRWVPMTKDHWPTDDLENFNDTVGRRYGIFSGKDGLLMWRSNVIVYKDLEYRKRELDARDELAQRYFKQVEQAPEVAVESRVSSVSETRQSGRTRSAITTKKEKISDLIGEE